MASQVVAPGLALTTTVDTVAQVPLGTVVEDEFGNEYIYLLGVASTVAGSFVVYNVSTFATTLTVGASAGRCAIAMAATVASTYGWYCQKGQNIPCVTAAAVVVNAAVYIVTGSPGQVDDAVVATDRIENAYFTSVATPAGFCTIYYPQAIALG